MPMLNARSISSSRWLRAPEMSEERRHRPRAVRSTSRAQPSGSIRGRFSVMPPPVMCAMPFTSPASSSGDIARRYERCGASSASPIVVPSSGASSRATDRDCRTTPGAPANIRWCADPTTADRQRIAGRDRTAVDDPGLFHDADDESGDVVLTVRVEAWHFSGLAADQRAHVFAARTRDADITCSATSGDEPAGRQVVQEEQRDGHPARGCR